MKRGLQVVLTLLVLGALGAATAYGISSALGIRVEPKEVPAEVLRAAPPRESVAPPRVRVTAPDGTARTAGAFTLHSHIYPIRGPHADRGPIGAFGVGRSGGRIHNGFDVNAACGTKLVAARGGRVVRAGYDPVLYGNVVIVRGERTQRDYWYSHLLRTPRVRVGERVSTGQRIGSIGATGNARTIGCHLHFEIRRRGVPIDPAPELHAWDAWS
jgi:murein DD-endopeptidase MepM/ murein hydrolase activator NlpD